MRATRSKIAMKHRPRKGRRFIEAGMGSAMTEENLVFIPADVVIKPLRDQLILEPIEVVYSRYLIVPQTGSKLIRGIVRAIGPGIYPHQYRDRFGNPNPKRHERAQLVAGMVFRPTVVQVLDTVHLDGRQSGATAFEQFFWGDTLCLHAREEDVAGVES